MMVRTALQSDQNGNRGERRQVTGNDAYHCLEQTGTGDFLGSGFKRGSRYTCLRTGASSNVWVAGRRTSALRGPTGIAPMFPSARQTRATARKTWEQMGSKRSRKLFPGFISFNKDGLPSFQIVLLKLFKPLPSLFVVERGKNGP